MASPEEKTAASGGISALDPVDVEALFARLKDELARGGADDETPAARRARLRSLAERFWPVSAERPLPSGPKGFVQRLLRKLMRWYVEPLATEQRTFNDAALKLIDELAEEADRARADAERATAAVRELEERLARLERRERVPANGSPPPPATVASQPAAAALPDYFAFESRMRGSTETIRERQRPYVELFRDAAPVLDAGSGRGEFLGLLREAGIEAYGVDADADMVAYARGEGHDVDRADALAHLEGLDSHSLGGIFAAQLVEHLPPATLLRFLELAAAKLRPGGVLVAETINPLSPLALRSYFADLTHAQPLVPETLELLARQAGFRETELRFANEPVERLEVPDDDAAAAANAERLNELLFGPLDYALVARA